MKKESAEQNSKKNKACWFLLLFLGLALFATGLFMGIRTWNDYRSAQQFYQETQADFVTVAAETPDAGENTGETESEVLPEWAQMVQVDFDALQSVNPDIIGWLWFENEDISYPILQGSSNQQYLRTTYEGTAATAGSIFMECLNSPDFSDSHTIIYGHNMHDETMFGKLKFYRKTDYYAQHQYFQVITPSASYRYQIFAYEDVAEDSFIYQVPFGENEEFAAFLSDILDLSLLESDISVDNSDKIITLSTCSSTGRRFVVHAKRVDEIATGASE